MRGLLVVNPRATATTERARDVLIAAIGGDVKLDVAHTQRRGHAIHLGRQAAADGLDVVVVLGGDGTVNEVVNGLLERGPGPDVPALAVVPGGSTNVFSRALGLPRDPVEATSELLSALRQGRERTIGLGRADARYFTFSAGLGIDAQAVRTVERKRRQGRRSSAGLYIRSTVGEVLTRSDRRHPQVRVERAGCSPVGGLFFGIVSNTSPWTYIGGRPVVVSPEASFHTGLELFALRRFALLPTLRVAAGMLSARGRGPGGRAVVRLHDLAEFRLVAERPMAFQVDGDYLGERESVHLAAVPRALRVLA